MANIVYYTAVGSYGGAVKISGRWVPVREMNRIDKTGWHRFSGPPTPALARALKRTTGVMLARKLFPDRAIVAPSFTRRQS